MKKNIMKIKAIIGLLLFSLAIISIITPVNAELSPYLNSESYKPVNGKTKIYLDVYSDLGTSEKNYNSANYVSKRKADFNKVSKYVITINGYKPIIYKKPVKGWKISSNNGYKAIYFGKSFSVKGNPNGKSYSLKLYNKKGKLIYNEKGKLFNGLR
ncbi:MAG: hypothetical protein LBU74_02015 [Methanobacteriaceae archaeon]|jgi:hypothetical protein|nr:hypothetical protein [Candidatus Methanorudis spinitermitis]